MVLVDQVDVNGLQAFRAFVALALRNEVSEALDQKCNVCPGVQDLVARCNQVVVHGYPSRK